MIAFLRVIWSVGIGMFALVLVISAFHISQTPFQTVAVAGITLVYVTTVSAFRITNLRMTEQANGEYARFVVLLRSLGSPEVEQYKKVSDEIQETNRQLLFRAIVPVAFEVLLATISIYELVSVALD